MKSYSLFLTIFVLLSPFLSHGGEERTLSLEDFRSKMKAGWIGQMAGVGLGAPTEFRWNGEIIPEDAMPRWEPGRINQFSQDDLYVEMTFLRTLEVYGWDVSIRQAGIDFANTGYILWHANSAGRALLREGIAPPDSGHPRFNPHADDIDYQIEADFSGLIAPGMPQVPVDLGEVFGRLMNYGDGVYGGQFIGAMYAAAFFETDPEAIVEAGMRAIPEGSQYFECVADTLRWFRENPEDWTATWRKLQEKYDEDPDYRRFSCFSLDNALNIDAKLNGAYVVMGLLYGGGDPERTLEISTRCGQDSDCNPSSAAGILFTALGMDGIPEKYHAALEMDRRFYSTPYTFAGLLDVCERLARQAVRRTGGAVVGKGTANERWVIPTAPVKSSALEQSWDPGPIAGAVFSDAELRQIRYPSIQGAVDRLMPGFVVGDFNLDWGPGLYSDIFGPEPVLHTWQEDGGAPITMTRRVQLPPEGPLALVLDAGRVPWNILKSEIEVAVDGRVLKRLAFTPDNAPDGVRATRVDLAAFAGREVLLQLRSRGNTLWKSARILGVDFYE